MGASKQWYGVPGNESKNFEKVILPLLKSFIEE
jgi:hypothetical protein